MKEESWNAVTLQDLLEIENENSILDFMLPTSDVPVWLFIRCEFFRSIIEELFYSGSNFLVSTHNASRFRAAKAVVGSLCHNFIHRGTKAKISIFSSASGFLCSSGDWLNRLSDLFALQYPDQSLVLEDISHWNLRGKRINSRFLYHMPIILYSKLYERIHCSKWEVNLADGVLQYAFRRAEDLFGWRPTEKTESVLRDVLVRRIAGYKTRESSYIKFLKKARVSLVIKEEGCYGHSIPLMKAARANDVITAEYQHGMVSSGHDAYNFSETLQHSRLVVDCIPSYFLGYGSWWNDKINVPVEKKVIGNPYRSLVLEKFQKKNKNNVLVLGDAVETKKYFDLSSVLSEKLGNKWTVIFRPHPLESDRARKMFSRSNLSSFRLDYHGDIYDSFSGANVVIGEVSTALFEAIGLVPRIFRWDTEKAKFSCPENIFDSFVNIEELICKILNDSTVNISNDLIEKIWASEWRANYSSFLKSINLLEG